MLIRAVPLKDEGTFFDDAYAQLKSLYKKDLKTQEDRKKDFTEFLHRYEGNLSGRSEHGIEERQSEVKTYLISLETELAEKEQADGESAVLAEEIKNSSMKKLEPFESEKLSEDDFGHKKNKT